MPAFNSVTAAEAGRKGRGDCGKGKRQSPRNQVLKLQDIAMIAVADPQTPVAVKAAIMRAYVDLQEMRMSLEGIGKPKPVEARNATPKKKRDDVTAPVVYPGPGPDSAASAINDVKPAS